MMCFSVNGYTNHYVWRTLKVQNKARDTIQVCEACRETLYGRIAILLQGASPCILHGKETEMFIQTQYLTSEGQKAIEDRLKYLKEYRRAQIAERLNQALDEGGDLNENAEYTDAKDDQAFVEGEILRLEDIVGHSQLIEMPVRNKSVKLGSTVILTEEGSKKREIYRLIGSAEANPAEGKISNAPWAEPCWAQKRKTGLALTPPKVPGYSLLEQFTKLR
jgi:transcription elongation factor GreA